MKASLFCWSGSVRAIDVNKGRLRILKETAKLHEVNDVITTIHADLREIVRNTKKKGYLYRIIFCMFIYLSLEFD